MDRGGWREGSFGWRPEIQTCPSAVKLLPIANNPGESLGHNSAGTKSRFVFPALGVVSRLKPAGVPGISLNLFGPSVR